MSMLRMLLRYRGNPKYSSKDSHDYPVTRLGTLLAAKVIRKI